MPLKRLLHYLATLDARFLPKPPTIYRIHLDADTVRIFEDDRQTATFTWPDVTAIHAELQDVFTVDRIWLHFTVTNPADPATQPHNISVHEEFEGYEALVAEIDQRFPDRDHNWWRKTAFPPLVEKFVVVWKK